MYAGELEVEGSGIGVWCLVYRVWDLGIRVEGLGCGIWSLGCKVARQDRAGSGV